MQQIDVTAKRREKSGKGIARGLRHQGLIPAILYGGEAEPMPLAIEPQQLKGALGGQNTLINLKVEGESSEGQLSILREVQRDLLKGRILHADLMRISMDKKLTLEVPVVLVGQAVDVRDKKGILEQLLRSAQVECLPQDIPQRLEVDISNLTIGEPLHASDLVMPAGVEILEDPLQVVAMVSALAVEEVAPVAEAAAAAPGAAEPELVGKKEGAKEKEKE